MITDHSKNKPRKLFLQFKRQICYPHFALISTVDCPVVRRSTPSPARRRMLVAAAFLVAAWASYGLAATDARAGTKTWEMNQADPTAAGSPLASAVPENDAQQAATTDQAAGAAASATQQQPTNIVITIRINSPGVDGPISQTNVIVAGASGSNAASTTQSGVPGTGGATTPGQNAATGQQAGATATASQDAAQNLVVVVRINSPGNNGPISQTNAAAAGANAANTSTTNQGQPAAGSAPAATPASGGASRRPARRPASDRPRKQPAAAGTTLRSSAPPAAPAVRHESSTAAAVDRANAKHPASVRAHGKAKRAGASSFDRASAATPLKSVAGSAADVFHAVAPPTSVAKVDSADVSQPVLYSLLAVLAAVAAFLVWPQRPDWLRPTRLRG
jgi:hypothetical protein